MTRRPVHPRREWRLSLSRVDAETGRIYGSHMLTREVLKNLWALLTAEQYEALLVKLSGAPDIPEMLRAVGYPEHLIKAREEELAYQAQERAEATHEHTGVAGTLEEV